MGRVILLPAKWTSSEPQTQHSKKSIFTTSPTRRTDSSFLLTRSSHYFGYRLPSFASSIQKKTGIWIGRMRMHPLQPAVYTLSQGAIETKSSRLFSAQINLTG